MSIGPNSPIGYSLPASIIGSANRNLNETQQSRAEQSQQNLKTGQRQLSTRDNEDVMETGLSADRDVDGRLPYELPQGEENPDEAEEESQDSSAGSGSHRGVDPEGDRGTQLDLDA